MLTRIARGVEFFPPCSLDLGNHLKNDILWHQTGLQKQEKIRHHCEAIGMQRARRRESHTKRRSLRVLRNLQGQGIVFHIGDNISSSATTHTLRLTSHVMNSYLSVRIT